MMKKRWLSLFVENDIGVLARISGLFSGKSYNLNSLTVGVTEDTTISRMTISLTSDDKTFEQIKKQINRSVEVIKVVDFTNIAIHMKELMFVKIHGCSGEDMMKLSYMKEAFQIKMIDYAPSMVLIVSETILALLPTIESFEKSYSTDVIIFPGLVICIKEQMVYRDYKLVPSFS